ncbi:hypothetical protein GCM10023331_37190 [Algivirga pacifica]|uniref:Uncharacterized protein n=2 Tax=Algivirga pacifica TaxID=1162670 RepID=A0ABP9DNF8_9BACT
MIMNFTTTGRKKATKSSYSKLLEAAWQNFDLFAAEERVRREEELKRYFSIRQKFAKYM